MVDGDVLTLSDAVGTVGGLLLDGGIPPWIQMNDIVGTREVETQSASLEADEKYRTLPVLFMPGTIPYSSLKHLVK